MAYISRTYGKILAFVLSLLGFSAILSSCVKYGAPVSKAIYKAKGIVVSKTNDTPIEGIRAVLKGHFSYGLDTVYTDNRGVFNLKSKKIDDLGLRFFVELTDVDGEKNGSFNDMEVEADYYNANFTGGNKKLYRGEAEKDLGVIKLETKE